MYGFTCIACGVFCRTSGTATGVSPIPPLLGIIPPLLTESGIIDVFVFHGTEDSTVTTTKLAFEELVIA